MNIDLSIEEIDRLQAWHAEIQHLWVEHGPGVVRTPVPEDYILYLKLMFARSKAEHDETRTAPVK